MDEDYYQVAAAEFYRVLFEKLPGIREHFGDAEKQRVMFEIAMRTVASKSIDDPELTGFLKALGENHKKRGITSIQMKVGRVAFVAALDILGEGLDRDTRLRHLEALRKLEEALGF